MPVTRDIVATYRGPGKVVRRILDMGQREDRTLMIVMAGCAVMFIAQWPYLARQAHLEGSELNAAMAATLMAWVIIAPLLLYILAGVSHLIALVLGGKGSSYGARVALFWALLAASPLVLLHGLTKGMMGLGVQEQLVGLLWLLCFLWFWLAGLWQAEKS